MTPLDRAVEAMLKAERFDWLHRADRWIVFSRSALDACVQPIAVYDTEAEAMETAKRMTARAALLAAFEELRNPTSPMLDAAMAEEHGLKHMPFCNPTLRQAWRVMLDALIKEAGNGAA